MPAFGDPDLCPICGTPDHTCVPHGYEDDIEPVPRFVKPVPDEERTVLVVEDVIEPVLNTAGFNELDRLVVGAGARITETEAEDLRERGLLQ